MKSTGADRTKNHFGTVSGLVIIFIIKLPFGYTTTEKLIAWNTRWVYEIALTFFWYTLNWNYFTVNHLEQVIVNLHTEDVKRRCLI